MSPSLLIMVFFGSHVLNTMGLKSKLAPHATGENDKALSDADVKSLRILVKSVNGLRKYVAIAPKVLGHAERSKKHRKTIWRKIHKTAVYTAQKHSSPLADALVSEAVALLKKYGANMSAVGSQTVLGLLADELPAAANEVVPLLGHKSASTRKKALHVLQQAHFKNKGAAELVVVATGTQHALKSLHRLVEHLDQLGTYVEVAPTLLDYAERETTSESHTEYIWKIHKKAIYIAQKHSSPLADALVALLKKYGANMSAVGSQTVLGLLADELPAAANEVVPLLSHKTASTGKNALHVLQQAHFKDKGAAELVVMATGTRQALKSLHRLVVHLDQLGTYVEVAPTLLDYAERETMSQSHTESIWNIHKEAVQTAAEHPLAEALVDVAVALLEDGVQMSNAGSEAVLGLLTKQGRTELPKGVTDGVVSLLKHESASTRKKAMRLLQQVDFDTLFYAPSFIDLALRVDREIVRLLHSKGISLREHFTRMMIQNRFKFEAVEAFLDENSPHFESYDFIEKVRLTAGESTINVASALWMERLIEMEHRSIVDLERFEYGEQLALVLKSDTDGGIDHDRLLHLNDDLYSHAVDKINYSDSTKKILDAHVSETNYSFRDQSQRWQTMQDETPELPRRVRVYRGFPGFADISGTIVPDQRGWMYKSFPNMPTSLSICKAWRFGGLRAEHVWRAPYWNTRTIASFELPEGFRDYVPIISYIKKSGKFDYFQDELEYVLTKPQWWKLDGVTTHEMFSSFRPKGRVLLRVLRFGLARTNPSAEATPFAQQFPGWSDQTSVKTQRLVIQANLAGAAEGLRVSPRRRESLRRLYESITKAYDPRLLQLPPREGEDPWRVGELKDLRGKSPKQIATIQELANYGMWLDAVGSQVPDRRDVQCLLYGLQNFRDETGLVLRILAVLRDKVPADILEGASIMPIMRILPSEVQAIVSILLASLGPTPAPTEDWLQSVSALTYNVSHEAMAGSSEGSAGALGKVCADSSERRGLNLCYRNVVAVCAHSPFDLVALQESTDKLAADVAMELQQRHMMPYGIIGGKYASIVYNQARLRCTGDSFRWFKGTSDKRPIVSASFEMGQVTFAVVNVHAPHGVEDSALAAEVQLALKDVGSPSKVILMGDFNRMVTTLSTDAGHFRAGQFGATCCDSSGGRGRDAYMSIGDLIMVTVPEGTIWDEETWHTAKHLLPEDVVCGSALSLYTSDHSPAAARVVFRRTNIQQKRARS